MTDSLLSVSDVQTPTKASALRRNVRHSEIVLGNLGDIDGL